MAKKRTATGRKMSVEHKAVLARGRQQGRAVREYLTALNEVKKPGRKLDSDSLQPADRRDSGTDRR